MTSTIPAQSRDQDPRGSNLDVDWLLHPKREFNSPQTKDKTASQKQEPQPVTTPQTQPPAPAPAPTSHPRLDTTAATTVPEAAQSEPQKPQPAHTASKDTPPASPATGSQVQAARAVSEDPKKSSRGLKKDGRRASWFSSLGHKISGSSSTPRSGSVDASPAKTQSPRLEFQNPFDKNTPASPGASPAQDKEKKREVVTHHVPQGTRRPSVLVAAGTETKLDHPGFLTSALRRLSSGSAATLGKGAGSTNAAAPRRIMNVDQNRERSKIPEFEQNKLRRVAFCVDVEIAGIASQAFEEGYGPAVENPVGSPPVSNAAKSIEDSNSKKPSTASKYKEKGEGAALKDPGAAQEEKEVKEELDKTREYLEADTDQKRKDALAALEGADPQSPAPASDTPAEKPMTRKKEKKKRSEAERKERRERKRRHAEMNGLVPLELTRDDDDSDSSTETPAGSSTPRNGDKPTTNPLRIYKRCCQLRETTAMSLIKEQISRPAATLAEAPGTVASIDLSGSRLALQDIVTFGDFLAVVPVRKLILENCDLGDEAVRVILSGLLSCKTSEQARQNRKLPKRGSGKRGQEQLGVIERLSLKNNPAITSIGWKHIGLFVHLCRSLCAIDLTGIQYPKSAGDVSRAPTGESGISASSMSAASKPTTEIGSLVARAIHERYGEKLEELILSSCSLSTSNVAEIVDAAIQCRIRRLGLAANRLNNEAMAHVVRYAVSDVCEGLDLGSNDLHDNSHLLSQVIHEKNPMIALSLADCNLTAEDLTNIVPKLCELKNFKFLDLSRNHGLFEGETNAVHILRKNLPRMKALKRLHLADVGLKPNHIIALSDVFPDCQSLAHINILDNAPLLQVMNSGQIEFQEDAAAFFASLMTATRVSHTLVAVELEVPGPDSSEVVKALSQQVVAYSLRNMERSALSDFGVESKAMPDQDAPEVLLHLVGHMDGYKETYDKDEPAPDEDYLIASTGVVRALEVCLGNTRDSRNASRNMTPTASGAGTPRTGPLRPHTHRKKPKDVSRELCESARKIRTRLQPALVKEDKAGNHEAYRRLWFLDQTLQGIIQRFEDEYPDARAAVSATPPELDISSPADSPNLSRLTTAQDENVRPDYDRTTSEFGTGLKPSPSASSTSLHSKALVNEEGRMLKFGQSMRRDVLKPVGTDDYAHGTSVHDAPEPAHLEALRNKLSGLSGEEIRHKVEAQGADNVVKELSINAEELRVLAIEDPIGFEALHNCALMEEVRRLSSRQAVMAPIDSNRTPRIPGTFNEQVTSGS